MTSIEARLNKLESLVDDQQAQIEAHKKTIAAQQETIDAQRERLDAVENDDGGVSMPISRRGALQAGGVLGLLGLGAGTASATTGTGQIGTESNSVDTVFTNTITNSDGENIEIAATDDTLQSTIELGTDFNEFVNFNLGAYTPITLGGDTVQFNTGESATNTVNLNGAGLHLNGGNITDNFDSPIWNSEEKEIPADALAIWDSAEEEIPANKLDIDGIADALTVEDSDVVVNNEN